MSLTRHPKLALLTFASGPPRFDKAASRLIQEARASHHFHSLRKSDIRYALYTNPYAQQSDVDFVRKNPKALGYYLWKPLLLRRAISHLAPDEALLFLDAGCELNLRGQTEPLANLHECLSILDDQPVLAANEVSCEARFTKADTLKLFNAYQKARERNQFQCSVIFMRASKAASAYLDEWLAICRESDYRYFDNSASRAKNVDDFVEHRWEQSIFSLLYYERGFSPLPVPIAPPNVTLFVKSGGAQSESAITPLTRRWGRLEMGPNPYAFSRDFRKQMSPYPFWASRNRSSLPLHRPGLMGSMSRLFRFSFVFLIRAVAQMNYWLRSFNIQTSKGESVG